MTYEVIGVTNDITKIPEMLGVPTVSDIVLCESENDGVFYAKKSSNGQPIGPLAVRLISDAQAEAFEKNALAAIERAQARINGIKVPTFDKRVFDASMAAARRKVITDAAERMNSAIERRTQKAK